MIVLGFTVCIAMVSMIFAIVNLFLFWASFSLVDIEIFSYSVSVGIDAAPAEWCFTVSNSAGLNDVSDKCFAFDACGGSYDEDGIVRSICDELDESTLQVQGAYAIWFDIAVTFLMLTTCITAIVLCCCQCSSSPRDSSKCPKFTMFLLSVPAFLSMFFLFLAPILYMTNLPSGVEPGAGSFVSVANGLMLVPIACFALCFHRCCECCVATRSTSTQIPVPFAAVPVWK
jgi:hypothetical protein